MNFVQNQIKNSKLSNALISLAAMIVIAVSMVASGATDVWVIGIVPAVLVCGLGTAFNVISAKMEEAAQEADVISLADHRNATQDMEVAA